MASIIEYITHLNRVGYFSDLDLTCSTYHVSPALTCNPDIQEFWTGKKPQSTYKSHLWTERKHVSKDAFCKESICQQWVKKWDGSCLVWKKWVCQAAGVTLRAAATWSQLCQHAEQRWEGLNKTKVEPHEYSSVSSLTLQFQRFLRCSHPTTSTRLTAVLTPTPAVALQLTEQFKT